MVFEAGRSGDLSGIFVDTDVRVKKLVETKMNIYFGEVLGKHSEVVGPVAEKEIELITNDPTAVKMFETLKMQTGFNPFHYPSYGFEDDKLSHLDELPETSGDIIDLLLQ